MKSENHSGIEEFIFHYARLLDERRFDEWLGLFADDAFYGVIRSENRARGALLYLVKEDKKQLESRVNGYRHEDLDKTLRMVTNPEAKPEGEAAAWLTAYFSLYRKGQLCFIGEYRIGLVLINGDWRIRRCEAIVDNAAITSAIQLPI